MKAKRLEIMQSNGINVPKFIVINNRKDIDSINNIDLSFSINQRFAVRSSCNSEDNDKLSHAGEFKTILNVSRADVKNAVNEVFDSYRDSDGQVIIQEMIDSDISGIIFTANPLGVLSDTIIVAGYGLGDNTVDNKKPTSEYCYNNEVELAYTIRESNDTPKLKSETINDLVKYGKRIKKLFGYEVDIEYAISNSQIYILQSRPITTLNKNSNSKIIVDNSNIVESYPGVSLPLTQDFVSDIYYRIFKRCIMRITKDEKLVKQLDNTLKNMVTTVNWNFYYIISNWYTILKLLPFSNKIIDIWQNMLGVKNKSIEYINFGVGIKTKFKIVKNFIYYLIHTKSYMMKLNNQFKIGYTKYRNKLNNEDTVNGLLSLYENIKNSILEYWDITLINDMYTFIFASLSDKCNISKIKGLASGEQEGALRDLINTSRNIANIENTEEFKRYIQDYGDRCIGELKLETPTFRTNPELLINYIKEHSKLDSSQVLEKAEGNKFKPKTIFERNAIAGIKNREESRLNRSRLFGLARDIFIKIGDILVDKNILEDSRDIFYLYMNEIYDISNKDINSTHINNIVKHRKDEQIIYSLQNMPRRIIFDTNIIREINYGKQIIEMKNSKNIFIGEGVSKGIDIWTYGEAIVVNKPDNNIDYLNKIVITHMTDPGWVFIIRNSLGIVTEQGSLLSHTAIISRELNKAAIVNVKNITNIIHTGDKIKINGVTGEVIVEEQV